MKAKALANDFIFQLHITLLLYFVLKNIFKRRTCQKFHQKIGPHIKSEYMMYLKDIINCQINKIEIK